MKIEGQLVFHSCAFTLDGGSKSLSGKDSTGRTFQFSLPQYTIEGNFIENRIPGRLHVNEKPLELRSQEENDVLGKLLNAKIKTDQNNNTETSSNPRLIFGQDIKDYFSALEKGPDSAIAHILKEIIEFVQSDEYIEVANKFIRK